VDTGLHTQYGLSADAEGTTNHNLSLALLSMPPEWYYFSRPSNMAYYDLTILHAPPPAFRLLLGLGLNFCPIPEANLNRALRITSQDLN
jgi:hypothetical protein